MSTTPSILIVEDEPNLGDTLRDYMEMKGHQTYLAKNSHEARELFSRKSPSVVLMDIHLPGESGFVLARDFRSQCKNFTLLFLSAQNDPHSRVEGLEMGAEDYITKPFELKELTLRLERILAFRKDVLEPDVIVHGPLQICFSRYEVRDANGQTIPLSHKECAILKELYFNKEQVVSRDNLISRVWGEGEYPSPRTVDNYMVKLRKWCETDEQKHLSVQSVWGVGYKLTIKKIKG